MNWLQRILALFDLPITANEATVSGHRTPMGYIQVLHGAIATAQKLAVPAGFAGFVPGYMIVQCVGAAATDYAAWRDDGVAPSATIGMRLVAGQELDYSGDLAAIQFIVGAGSPDLNISFYA